MNIAMSSFVARKRSEQKSPADFVEALAAAPTSRAQWGDLTSIARRDFITWIEAARQANTRKRRIEKACSMLASGKRRPCCYSIVSLDLHQALTANPKAKAQWSKLDSNERRDLIAWMDCAREAKAHKSRIEQACRKLAAGEHGIGSIKVAAETPEQTKKHLKQANAPRFNSVEAYLASLDGKKAQTLRSLLNFVLAQFPMLESTMAWNVPQIHLNGQYVVGIAPFKNHLTFAPWSARVIKHFRPRLKDFVVKANCFQFPVDWEIDKELVIALVKARLAELDEAKPDSVQTA